MTSTTLNYKGGFKAAFKKNFKQQLPGAIILIILSILVSVYSASNTIISNSERIASDVEYYSSNITKTAESILYNITDNSYMLVMGFGIACVIFSLFLAVQMFKEIYSKRACDTFFSLPIKRSEYFCAKYLFGLITNVLSLILTLCVYVVIMLSASTKQITYTVDVVECLKVSVAFILNVICFYSIFIFCAVLAGKKIHYFFFAVIAAFAPLRIIAGIESTISSVWGVDVDSFFLTILHPAQSFIAMFLEGYTSALTVSSFVTILIVELVEIIALFFGSYFVFKNRKAEVAEFQPSGKVVPLVFLGLIVGGVFGQIIVGTSSVTAVIISVILAVLLTIVFGLIFYKKAFEKNTIITFAISSVVCIVFIVTAGLFNYSSFVKYVPEIDEIESVELSDSSMDSIYGASFMSSYSSIMADNSGNVESVVFSDKEGIKNAIALHKKIVDDETIKKGMALSSDSWSDMMDYNYEYVFTYDCRLVYHLKNGRTVKRKYSVPSNMISNEFVTLMRSDEALSQIGVTSLHPDDMLYTTSNGTFNGKDALTDRSLTQQEYEQLLKLYKEDLINSISKEEFLSYLSEYTGYYIDTNSDDYEDYNEYGDVFASDYKESFWIYTLYTNSDISDDEREYYKSKSIEELDRLSSISSEYYEKLSSDIISIYPEYENSCKYLQSIGIIE